VPCVVREKKKLQRQRKLQAHKSGISSLQRLSLRLMLYFLIFGD